MMKTTIATAVALLFVTYVAAAQQTDPWVGTWKLNVEKSKADPGPTPKSQTLRIENVAGGGQRHTFDGVGAEGKPTHTERTFKFDGTDAPVENIQPPPTAKVTNSIRRVDERSFEVTIKRDGKVTGTTRGVVSADGKTLTTTATGTNPEGRKINNVAVYERQ